MRMVMVQNFGHFTEERSVSNETERVIAPSAICQIIARPHPMFRQRCLLQRDYRG